MLSQQELQEIKRRADRVLEQKQLFIKIKEYIKQALSEEQKIEQIKPKINQLLDNAKIISTPHYINALRNVTEILYTSVKDKDISQDLAAKLFSEKDMINTCIEVGNPVSINGAKRHYEQAIGKKSDDEKKHRLYIDEQMSSLLDIDQRIVDARVNIIKTSSFMPNMRNQNKAFLISLANDPNLVKKLDPNTAADLCIAFGNEDSEKLAIFKVLYSSATKKDIDQIIKTKPNSDKEIVENTKKFLSYCQDSREVYLQTLRIIKDPNLLKYLDRKSAEDIFNTFGKTDKDIAFHSRLRTEYIKAVTNLDGTKTIAISLPIEKTTVKVVGDFKNRTVHPLVDRFGRIRHKEEFISPYLKLNDKELKKNVLRGQTLIELAELKEKLPDKLEIKLVNEVMQERRELLAKMQKAEKIIQKQDPASLAYSKNDLKYKLQCAYLDNDVKIADSNKVKASEQLQKYYKGNFSPNKKIESFRLLNTVKREVLNTVKHTAEIVAAKIKPRR